MGVESDPSDVHDDERADFRRELGVLNDGLDDPTAAGYKLLDLISFLTTGRTNRAHGRYGAARPHPEAGRRDKRISATNSSARKSSVDVLLEAGVMVKGT